MFPRVPYLVTVAVLLVLGARPALCQATAGEQEFLRTLDANLPSLKGDDEAARQDAIQDQWDSMEELLFARFEAQLPDEERKRRGVGELLRFRRADVQVGSSTSGSGTTSSVFNPLLPAAFGFALESGSITRSITGTTATIQINPAGLFCASGDNATAVRVRDNGCGSYDFARRLGVSLSFNTSRGEAPAGGLKPLGDQFAQAAIRAELVNRRQPSSPAFARRVAAWEAKNTPLTAEINRLRALVRSLSQDRNFRADFQARVEENLKQAMAAKESDEQLTSRILQAANAVAEEMLQRPEIGSRIDGALPVYVDAIKADRDLVRQLAHDWVVTAEYVFERPDISTEGIDGIVTPGERPPSLHAARLIAAKGLPDLNLDFTLNVSSSWFGEARPELRGQWRDFKIAGDAKFFLREIPDFGVPVISIAGLWMHLDQRPLGINVEALNQTEINQPGNLGVFQVKLELPTANAAMRIPISFTYASRTELIRESDVRGQIGITLNLDSLLAPAP